MSFIDWAPLARAGLFGGLFLVALFGVLWTWYDTTGRADGGWAWRVPGSLLVVLTVPAVFLGAANLDATRETLLNILGFLAIGCAVAALGVAVVYASIGRSRGVSGITLAPTAFEGEAMTLPRPLSPPETFAAPTIPTPTSPAKRRSARASEAYLFVKSGPDKGQQYPLDGTATIGRREGCDVVLEDRRISSEHGQIKRTDGNYVYTDLQSTNGSYLLVNGRDERIRGSQVLVDGDHLRLGQTVVEFVDTRAGQRR